MTEIGVKLITPIVNILLAHILLPSAFGVVASITLITSFAEMLQDAGFQKYLIQHSFKSNKERDKYANVAFWTNLGVSVLFCALIIAFRGRIALIIGISGNELALAIASLALPLAALCSIQTALFQRKLDFKSLFIVRVASAFIPLVITLPLAIFGWGYWSLIIGTLAGKAFNAAVLSFRSNWAPSFRYEFICLKEMWSFSAWTLLESISIWLTSWVGVFIIGSCMGEHYVGLYNNSIAVVNSVIAIVSASTASVLTSALSKMQDDRKAFEECFFKYQKGASFAVFLMGGLFLSFGQTINEILLGPNWNEAALLISLWGFSSALVVPFANYGSVVYVSLGKPKISFCVQVVYILILAPVTYFAAKEGFAVLSVAVASCRLAFVCLHLFVMRIVLGFSIRKMVSNTGRFFLVACLLSSAIWAVRTVVGWILPLDVCTGLVFCLVYALVFRNESFMEKLFLRVFLRR